jgi:hypothetical protein
VPACAGHSGPSGRVRGCRVPWFHKKFGSRTDTTSSQLDSNWTRLGHHRITDSAVGRRSGCIDSSRCHGASPSRSSQAWQIGERVSGTQAGQRLIGVGVSRGPLTRMVRRRKPVSHTPCFGEEGCDSPGLVLTASAAWRSRCGHPSATAFLRLILFWKSDLDISRVHHARRTVSACARLCLCEDRW